MAARKIEQIHPWDTLACCWDVKQPTNKQTSVSILWLGEIARFIQICNFFPVQQHVKLSKQIHLWATLCLLFECLNSQETQFVKQKCQLCMFGFNVCIDSKAQVIMLSCCNCSCCSPLHPCKAVQTGSEKSHCSSPTVVQAIMAYRSRSRSLSYVNWHYLKHCCLSSAYMYACYAGCNVFVNKIIKLDNVMFSAYIDTLP